MWKNYNIDLLGTDEIFIIVNNNNGVWLLKYNFAFYLHNNFFFLFVSSKSIHFLRLQFLLDQKKFVQT